MMANQDALLNSRRIMNSLLPKIEMNEDDAAEGGCGVVGLACEIPVAGRHLFKSLEQMRNRGNGKGGGVAMVGLDHKQFKVSENILKNNYLYAIAYLDNSVRKDVEKEFIRSDFEVDHIHEIPMIESWEDLPNLDVKPPDVVCYFIRPKPSAVQKFLDAGDLEESDFSNKKEMLDEMVFQNTHKLNVEYYAKNQRADAFVLSHGQNMIILKIVGYAEDVIRYYRLDDVTAHVWIGHHRYPTRGRVTHPGGAHPFGQGIDVALVHNGDFSNYESVKDYLGQRGMEPLFFTDTEVAALGFDLHSRVYGYPMEYVIESLAPTGELDFVMLTDEKQEIYEAIQKTHIHGSPDGPWFFIIAKANGESHQLIGITDTSMLRPQVFSYQRGEVAIAFCGSEKQVIDAVLESLSADDNRFWRRCDKYWNARGGSYTDGGSFIFNVNPKEDGSHELIINNKFGELVDTHPGGDYQIKPAAMTSGFDWPRNWSAQTIFADIATHLPQFDWPAARALLSEINSHASETSRKDSIELLCLLLNRKYNTGALRTSRWLDCVEDAIMEILNHSSTKPCHQYIGQKVPGHIPEIDNPEQTIVVDARPFPIEGTESLARELVSLYLSGWRNFCVTHCHGHRFIGNGLGMSTGDVRIDVFGSVGDYLGSGNDGMTIHMHGNAQDQVAQIHKTGTVVVHGDVGQCYGYGAKGGRLFVQGNAAGRPMINSVGTPKLVINGTALDYLAESFMAGDPLEGGGFVIINGISFDSEGEIVDLETPYPGGNLFSLSSGGAIYVRDPHHILSPSQLNGGEFVDLTDADWQVIQSLLIENEEHFGIPLARLLAIDGEIQPPSKVYRKIIPLKNKALSVEDSWAAKHD